MSFADVNRKDAERGGTWVKFTKVGQVVKGKLVDMDIRDQKYKGNAVRSAAGNVRKEYVLTLEMPDGSKVKVGLKEAAYIPLQKARADSGAEKWGLANVAILCDELPKQGESSGKFRAKYEPLFEQEVAEDDPWGDSNAGPAPEEPPVDDPWGNVPSGDASDSDAPW